MATSVSNYCARTSPLNGRNRAKHDAGMIPIVEFPGSATQIGLAVADTGPGDSRVFYTLYFFEPAALWIDRRWALESGQFIQAA
jgi:hypothetical protein